MSGCFFFREIDDQGNASVVVQDGCLGATFALLESMAEEHVEAVFRHDSLPQILELWLAGARMGLQRQGITAGYIAGLCIEAERGTASPPLPPEIIDRFVTAISKVQVRQVPNEEAAQRQHDGQ